MARMTVAKLLVKVETLEAQMGLLVLALTGPARGQPLWEMRGYLKAIDPLLNFGTTPPDPEPTPDLRTELLDYARTLLGVPYEINLPGYPRQPGRGLGKQYPPDGGLDCSGFVLQCLQHIGLLLDLDPLYTSVVTLDRSSERIGPDLVLPGDLVFFADTYQPGLSHIGIVSGDSWWLIQAIEPRVQEGQMSDYLLSHLSHYGRVEGIDYP